MAALAAHYRSLFRRQWQLAEEAPHFYDHRLSSFALATGADSPFGYYRAYFAAQLMRSTDRVLDIGSGDGFFDHRFFRQRVAHVDAIDIEPSAISHAVKYYAAPNIRYWLRDAVVEPFPAASYDVVVWDGALGHFPAETSHMMLAKIACALSEEGAFVGSESLGREGHDHLQFFADTDALRQLLSQHFAIVDLCEVGYPLAGGTIRREAFWRCAQRSDRLDAAAWER